MFKSKFYIILKNKTIFLVIKKTDLVKNRKNPVKSRKIIQSIWK